MCMRIMHIACICMFTGSLVLRHSVCMKISIKPVLLV
jgi:hypothetical protein